MVRYFAENLWKAIVAIGLALGDRFWLFIQTLNSAKISFNSIFNSKENSKYSFKEFIHSMRKKLFKTRGQIYNQARI